ncbi:magnesium and cobalt transport protein CorA [Spongiactinospora rosea]|uniref:Magnesium transport protein CorA n=1 Tax=Spongiactinospora rosea TaxID=2248750 RepID=A0A366M5B6_9ACTN|nr:magnesium/cobalt transporter CorA [Spongiactinospora rosea]RBQ21391.1 magnesium and cobalt transport protein CorA [Spongiactinospora rosea]
MRSSMIFPRIRHHRAAGAQHGRRKPPVTATPVAPVECAPAGGCVPPSDSLVDSAAYLAGAKVEAAGIEAALSLVRAHNASNGGGGFVWVGLHEPESPEVEWLAEVFGLHPLAVEDAVKAHQRPKVERYGDSLFVVLKTVAFVEEEPDSEIIATGEIMLFVGPDFVVTVRHGRHCPLTGVRDKLEDDPKLLGRGPAGVLHAIADHVVDEYLSVADQMQEALEEVEAAVFADVSSRDIGRIYHLKREMIEMKRAVTPLVAPLGALPQRRVIPPEMRDYFRDVGDHLSRVCEQVESSNELCNSVLQAALARSNALANEDMRKISSWVAIMAAPTMIAGVYGMNFDFMPETKWVFGYPLIVGLMLLTCMLLYRSFRRKGWM